MKAQMINSVAIALFASLFALTSCNDDGLVEQVSPQSQEYNQSQQHSSSLSIEAPNNISPIYEEHTNENRTLRPIEVQGLAKTSVSRQLVEGQTFAANHDSPERQRPIASQDAWKYNVGGEATMEAGDLGPVLVQFAITNDPFTGESNGTMTIQSLNNRSSVISLRMEGMSNINDINSFDGYEFRLSHDSATEDFRDVERSGNGSLAVDFSDQAAQLQGQLLTRIEINLAQVIQMH